MFITLIIYSIAILGLWLLFLISRVHSYKFKHYSKIIAPVTRFIAVVFIVLTILGYIFIFLGLNNNSNNSNNSSFYTEDKKSYKNIDININETIEETSVDSDFDIIY